MCLLHYTASLHCQKGIRMIFGKVYGQTETNKRYAAKKMCTKAGNRLPSVNIDLSIG